MPQTMSRLDRVLALLRYKKWIIGNTLVVAVLAVIISLQLPSWYRSTTSIFPPADEGIGAGSLSSLITMSALGTGSQLPVWASPSDVYAAILHSRSVRETIIETFDLQEVYKTETLDGTLKVLGSLVGVDVGGSGVLFVSVEDKVPERAAEMANALVAELDRVNRVKRTSSAGVARQFIESRLDQTRVDLDSAEDQLRVLQEETGILVPEDQLRAFVRVASDLESQIVLKEVEVAVLESQLGQSHPRRGAAVRELAALEEKLRELDRGLEGDAGEERTGFDISLRDYPEKTLSHFRAVREVKIQESVFELLLTQYEQYRIQEQRDTPTVQILDQARPADKKSRPRRSILCIAATLLAFAGSVLIAASLDAIVRMRGRTPEDYNKLHRIASEFGLGRFLDRLT